MPGTAMAKDQENRTEPFDNQAEARLRNIMAWIRTAKESLPAMNNGRVSAARIAAMSTLLDRLHHVAERLQPACADKTAPDRRHAA